MKINIQEMLSKLKNCPVCGEELVTPLDYPQERCCRAGCGDFTMTAVHWDGDVDFSFKMVFPDKEPEPENVIHAREPNA